MVKKTSTSELQKMTVTFPGAVLRHLKDHVATRERSAFIVQAVEEKLALQEQLAAIEETAGSWKDKDHGEMQDDEGIDHWLAELRKSWDEHLTDIGAQDGEGQLSSR